MTTSPAIQLSEKDRLLLRNLNTGIRYNSDEMKNLKDGEMYLGVFHGRTFPDQQLNDWGIDGFVYGPISKFIVEEFHKMSIVDMEGNIIPLPVHEDMVCLDANKTGKVKERYYGDLTVFVQGVDIPLHTNEKYPVAAYPFNGDTKSQDLKPAIYIDGQNTKPTSDPLLQRALIGPVKAVHTTYLYHIRMDVNHISHEWSELNFNDTELVDGNFDKMEYFVVR